MGKGPHCVCISTRESSQREREREREREKERERERKRVDATVIQGSSSKDWLFWENSIVGTHAS